MALKTISPRLKTIDTRTALPPPKVADSELLTPEHRAWAQAVKKRAGYRCEEILLDGSRCPKAAPAYRMYADHIVERRDGGHPTDPRNGRCLCGQHHTLKTASERAKRIVT